jgi:hypothetical protein
MPAICVPQDARARLLLSPWNEDERENPALKAPSHGCDHEVVALKNQGVGHVCSINVRALRLSATERCVACRSVKRMSQG